ncbi:hypothetical protein TU94_00590 [Streptomyces cyaneogriseus subsp. noncyanogenus]|uniref:Uncharacterized protein n=1 Tax=Streptomyces cyaneogriseus subsp. noncyanogenus TaxID=477245 RepID=A0A0C5FUY9_9ACTN|nr:hypothetical protein TU94_00590 [Streptomyces cyaneogriseus subsp. noncyanogenus]
MATDTSRPAPRSGTAPGRARPPETGAKPQRTPERGQGRMKAPRPARRARRAPSGSGPRRHAIRETWFRPAGPDGRAPTPEGS